MSFRYSVVPAGAITDRRLEPRDLQVLALLGRYNERGGWLWRNQSRMAAELGVTRRTIQRSLDRLVDASWVQKRLRGYGEKIPDPEKQPFSSLEYRVKLDNEVPVEDSSIDPSEEQEVSDRDEEGGASSVTHPCDTDDAGGASPMTHKIEPLGLLESESARAREPLISREAIETAEAIASIAGYPDPEAWPPGWCGAPMRVDAYLRQGYHPQHLLVGARAVMAGKSVDFKPWSIDYFARAFADARGRAEAPVPKPTNGGEHERTSKSGGGGNVNAAISSLAEHLAAATAQSAGGQDRRDPPRLLPKGRSG